MKVPLQIILFPIAFFISIPLLIIRENIEDVGTLDAFLALGLISLAVALILLLLFVHSVTNKTRISVLFQTSVGFLFFYIVISGFILPTAVSSGMVDPTFAAVDKPHFWVSLIAAILISWAATTNFQNAIYLGFLLFIGLNTAYSLHFVLPQIGGEDEYAMPSEVSETKNVFVLSLDGVSGTAVYEVLAENESLANKFEGFRFFKRVTSSSPATSASTATSLYGNKNYKRQFATDEELWNHSPQNLLTNFLGNNGYLVSTYSIYTKSFKDTSRIFRASALSVLSISELMSLTIARTLTSKFVIKGKYFGQLEFNLRQRFFSTPTPESEFARQISLSNAPSWKRGLSATKLDYHNYLEGFETSARTSSPVAHFVHFTFTHFPVEFDSNCVFRGHDLAWYEARQNWNGLKEETKCAVMMYLDFVEVLKKEGLFDQSLIVLKSDHGKPPKYAKSGTIESRALNGNSSWGYNRYAPFLAIRKFEPQGDMRSEDNSPVSLDDLAKTICYSTLGKSKCQQYPGFDILADNLIIPESSEITMYVVGSELSTFKYDSHNPVTIKRNPDILENLYRSLEFPLVE